MAILLDCIILFRFTYWSTAVTQLLHFLILLLHGNTVHRVKSWKRQPSDFHLEDDSINFRPINAAWAAEISEEARQPRPAGEGEAKGRAVF